MYRTVLTQLRMVGRDKFKGSTAGYPRIKVDAASSRTVMPPSGSSRQCACVAAQVRGWWAQQPGVAVPRGYGTASPSLKIIKLASQI
jgi:hypothetical protein